MTAKHEALRLADAIEKAIRPEASLPLADWTRAAAELRRLHEAHDWQYKMAGERLRRVEKLEAQRDALLEALKTYGWHTEDCPQHPTYAQPENWPDCTCGFDAAIRARGNVK